jgi:sugar lactone lactonase YvrE
VDSAGDLYIADTLNNRVRKVSKGVIATVAGIAEQGFSGDHGPAALARLFMPGGVAVDSGGNLYIADSMNYRVRKVAAGVITTVAGSGTQGFSGDDGPATRAELGVCGGIAADSAGNVYIADSSNNRIRVLTPSGPGR